MNRLQRLYYTLEAVGWDNVPRRIVQMVRMRLGGMRRRLPGGELTAAQWRGVLAEGYAPEQAVARWHERRARLGTALVGLSRAGGPWPVALSTAASADGATDCAGVVAALSAGRMPYFAHHVVEVGSPPDFHRNPIDGIDWPQGRHWTQYDQFNPALRDLKLVWEASRFSWAFALGRAQGAGRGAQGAAAGAAVLFWEWLEAWDGQNPYGLTVNWACGQEASFRLFAWLFAALNTLDSPAATPQRLARLTQLVWYTGRHVDGNINYARSQKNNHAISEAVALWTIGRLFPELRTAPHWAAKGRRILAAELRRQIYSDGSYVQHSHNYHRVMLDDVLWAAGLGRALDEPLGGAALARVEQAEFWLRQMIDPESGRVPNYGANDGALVLPLSDCDYRDYRPVAQAAHYLVHGTRCFPPGPWDEQAGWLFGPDALAAPVQTRTRRTLFRFSAGGYFVGRGPRSWSMIRCARYRDRPVQADQLHFDLWCDGCNVLRDAGSYHYFCEPPWQHHFLSTAAHNTVEVDGQDQMVKGPRFMWLRRAQGQVETCGETPDGRAGWFVGTQHGYARLPGAVIHRRAVVRIEDTYVVVDDVCGAGAHTVALRWRLCPGGWTRVGQAWQAPAAPIRLGIAAPAGFDQRLLVGSEDPPEGWESLYYAERRPIPVLRVAGRAALPLRLATVIAPAGDGLPTVELVAPGAPVRLQGVVRPEALPAELPLTFESS